MNKLKDAFLKVKTIPKKTFVFARDCEHTSNSFDDWRESDDLFLSEGKWVCSTCENRMVNPPVSPSLKVYILWLLSSDEDREKIEVIYDGINKIFGEKIEVSQKIYELKEKHSKNTRVLDFTNDEDIEQIIQEKNEEIDKEINLLHKKNEEYMDEMDKLNKYKTNFMQELENKINLDYEL